MLSRVADSLYWMARYIERAEHTARLLDTHLDLMLDQGTGNQEERWQRLRESLVLPAPADPHDTGTDPMVHYLVLDAENPFSILSSLGAARENARQLRQDISAEMWAHLNRLHLQLREPSAASFLAADPRGMLRRVIDGVSLFRGVTHSTISHGQCWQFIEVGRFLERAGSVAALLGSHFRHFSKKKEKDGVQGQDFMEWVGLLKACGGFEAYCNQYTADFKPEYIAEFLLLDTRFPRSVCFSAQRIDECLHRLGDLCEGPSTPNLHRASGKLASMLRYGQIGEILETGLPATAEHVREQCGGLHQAVYRAFVSFPLENALAA